MGEVLVMKIEIGGGLGDFKFGMSVDEIKKILGEPSEVIDKNEDGDIELYFKDDTLEFVFYEIDDFTLSNIIVDCDAGETAEYKGKDLFKLNLDDAMELLKEEGGEPEVETFAFEDEDMEDELVVDFESIGLTIFYDKDRKPVEVSISEKIDI